MPGVEAVKTQRSPLLDIKRRTPEVDELVDRALRTIQEEYLQLKDDARALVERDNRPRGNGKNDRPGGKKPEALGKTEGMS